MNAETSEEKIDAAKSDSPAQGEATLGEESKKELAEIGGDGHCVAMGDVYPGRTCCWSPSCSLVDNDGKVGEVFDMSRSCSRRALSFSG